MAYTPYSFTINPRGGQVVTATLRYNNENGVIVRPSLTLHGNPIGTDTFIVSVSSTFWLTESGTYSLSLLVDGVEQATESGEPIGFTLGGKNARFVVAPLPDYLFATTRDVPFATDDAAQGIHHYTTPTYGTVVSVGNKNGSVGFPGSGTPAEGFGGFVVYQEYGVGNENDDILKTTQGAYFITNYWGPTVDDSMEGISTFVGAKDTGTPYNQANPITAFEAIAQMEGGNTSSSYLLAAGARISLTGTSQVDAAYGFRVSSTSDLTAHADAFYAFVDTVVPDVHLDADLYFSFLGENAIQSKRRFFLGDGVDTGSIDLNWRGRNGNDTGAMLYIQPPAGKASMVGFRHQGIGTTDTDSSVNMAEWWVGGGASATAWVSRFGQFASKQDPGIIVTDASAVEQMSITRTGPRWAAGGTTQSTVGAAGGASAVPATPSRWLKCWYWNGSAIVAGVIPVYAAS